MPSDPLPVSDILAEPTKVADAQSLVRAMARLDAAARADPRLGAALSQNLVDLRAILAQVLALLASARPPAGDDSFAVERLQDIAIAIRRREVEAALCDALDAATREVGDAIVRNDAAAAGALSAVALIRDMARRVNDMITLAALLTDFGEEPHHRPPADETSNNQRAECFAATVNQSATHVADIGSREQHRMFREAPAPVLLPDVELDEESAGAPSPQPDTGANAATRPIPDAAPTDAFAGLFGLSEEELIALFS